MQFRKLQTVFHLRRASFEKNIHNQDPLRILRTVDQNHVNNVEVILQIIMQKVQKLVKSKVQIIHRFKLFLKKVHVTSKMNANSFVHSPACFSTDPSKWISDQSYVPVIHIYAQIAQDSLKSCVWKVS